MTDSIHFLVIFRPLLSNFMQNVGNSQDNYLAKSGRTQKKNGRKRPIFLRLIEIFFSTIGIYNQRCGGRHEWLSPNVGFTGSRWQQINNPGRKKIPFPLEWLSMRWEIHENFSFWKKFAHSNIVINSDI